MVTHKVAHKGEDGQVRLLSWKVDIERACRLVPSSSHTLLRNSIQNMATNFPNWYLGVSTSWSVPLKSRAGANFVITGGKIVCPASGEECAEKNLRPLFIGNLPLPIEGRPVLDRIKKDMRNDKHKRDEWNSHFLQAKKLLFMIPMSAGWMQQDIVTGQPWFAVHGRIWRILDIPIDHVYGADSEGGHRLCQYSSSRSGMGPEEAIQQRVVPRFIIDMMFGDIKAMGIWTDFKQWMRDNQTNMHSFYNVLGKTDNPTNLAFLEYYKKEVARYAQNA